MGNQEYISCKIIEHGFDAQIDTINLCCRVSKENTDKQVLISNYKGQKIDWDDFFAKTDELRNIQKRGDTVPCCKGCLYLENNVWEDAHYIETININNWIKCNADCIYCDRHEHKGEKEYNIYPIIKDLISKNLLKQKADITIAGGEPTITSDFDKTLKILIKNNISTVRVLTNAIKYNRHIERGLKSGLVNILVSTDSGTAKTYKAIKKVDKHKDVWKNIAKYAKNQQTDSLVKTKFIIIPGINDTKEEIYEYIKQNSLAGVKYACIDVEIAWFLKHTNDTEVLKEMYDLYLYAKKEGGRQCIKITPFDRMSIIESKINVENKGN